MTTTTWSAAGYDPGNLPGPYFAIDEGITMPGAIERVESRIGEVSKNEEWIIAKALMVSLGIGSPNSSNDNSIFQSKVLTGKNPEDLGLVSFKLNGDRTTLRCVPDSWTIDYPQLFTPFRLDVDGNILMSGEHIASPTETLPNESQCSTNIYYYSDGNRFSGDTSLTVNPVQTCPLRCGFCRRQYDSIDQARKDNTRTSDVRLKNFSPIDLAAELTGIEGLDWGSNMQVSFVTGAFNDFESMHDYVEAFISEMRLRTNGLFDPTENYKQNIHIMSHLARTATDFTRLKQMGARTYSDTIEVIDDIRRQVIMPEPRSRLVAPKGSIVFDDCVRTASLGIEVLGERNYSPTIISGLDAFNETIDGADRLYREGVRFADMPVLLAVEQKALKLYQDSPINIAASQVIVRRLFSQVYHGWRSPDLENA